MSTDGRDAERTRIFRRKAPVRSLSSMTKTSATAENRNSAQAAREKDRNSPSAITSRPTTFSGASCQPTGEQAVHQIEGGGDEKGTEDVRILEGALCAVVEREGLAAGKGVEIAENAERGGDQGAATQARKISRSRCGFASMIAAKKTDDSARNSETATYIGPSAMSVMTVSDSMPPMLKVSKQRQERGDAARDAKADRIAQTPISPAMKSS